MARSRDTLHWWLRRLCDPDTTWMQHAACRDVDPELMVPELGCHPADVAAAKAVCRHCPVSGPCLDYAIRHKMAGVWGGTTERDRRSLRRQHALKAVS